MRPLALAVWLAAAAGSGLWAGRQIERRANTPPVEPPTLRLREVQAEADRLRGELTLLRARQSSFGEGTPSGSVSSAAPAPPTVTPLESFRAALAQGDVGLLVERFLAALDAVPSCHVLLENFLRESAGKLPPEAAEALLRALDPRLQAALTKPGANPMMEARLIALIGGPVAVDLLWKAAETGGASQWRSDMAFCLAGVEGEEAREFILKALELPLDRAARQSLVVAGLAARPDMFDDLLALLAAGRIGQGDHHLFVSGLFRQCNEHPDAKDRLWAAAMSGSPAASSLLLSALVHARDPRAQDWLLEQIRAGRVDAIPPSEWGALTSDRLDRAKGRLAEIAFNPSHPFDLRRSVALTLSRVDPEAAASAILAGYERMPESGRLRAVEALRWQGTRESSARLRQIADTDPDEAVRRAAR